MGKKIQAVRNPDHPLWMWREIIDSLITLYGENSVMYIDSGRQNGSILTIVPPDKESPSED